MNSDSQSPRAPWLSLIVPTRGRPEQLNRFIASIDATVADPDGIELILVIDLDDESYGELPRTGFRVVRQRAAPNQTMGHLNRAGCQVATGNWLFLLNDDVVAKTEQWDHRIRPACRVFADEIALVHVNDGIFGPKLCTFPIVSRKYCELAGGICPEDYSRYRIDDHIYNNFNLLNVSGHHRILYLEDVLFDHDNRAHDAGDESAYQPNPVIHALDTEIFNDMLTERKVTALDIVGHIERFRASERRMILEHQLLGVKESVGLRRREFVSMLSPGQVIPERRPRVTIGIVSANVKNPHARLCIDAIKQFTSDFDLILLDNNRSGDFNHAREINRILSICRTDFAVLMDDDVVVGPGWLDGMMRAMTPDVGVVTPLHTNADGKLSYAGVVMNPDGSGDHGHDFSVPPRPVSIETLCGAIMLIDVRKCGHIRIDESFSKYFLDIEYGFRVWEAGYRVVLSPYSKVIHIGGGTLEQGSAPAMDLHEPQRRRFQESWTHSGRWERVRQSPLWRDDPDLQRLSRVAGDLDALLADPGARDRKAFETKLAALFDVTRLCRSLHRWVTEAIRSKVGAPGNLEFKDNNAGTALVVGHYIGPVLVEPAVDGYNIMLDRGEYFAVPRNEGAFTIERLNRGDFSRSYRAFDLRTIQLAIRARVSDSAPTVPANPVDVGRRQSPPLSSKQSRLNRILRLRPILVPIENALRRNPQIVYVLRLRPLIVPIENALRKLRSRPERQRTNG